MAGGRYKCIGLLWWQGHDIRCCIYAISKCMGMIPGKKKKEKRLHGIEGFSQWSSKDNVNGRVCQVGTYNVTTGACLPTRAHGGVQYMQMR